MREREALDEISAFNGRICAEPERSLWAVCKGYMDGLFGLDLLSRPEAEIREALGKANSAVGMKEPPKDGRLF